MRNSIFLLLLYVLCNELFAQKNNFPLVQFPNSYISEIDKIYIEVEGWEGKMDLYYDTTYRKPTALLINIHGGGWKQGVKESQYSFGSFFKHGFAVANIEYRLEKVSPAPAAIEDVKCALNYIYEHSKEFNIDTNKIVLMGGSAGGHLALMVGLQAHTKNFNTNCSNYKPIKIAAIIDKYGPTDLTQLLYSSSVKKWLRNYNNDIELIKSVSPYYQVSSQSPPTFIIHGTADPLVPYEQSVLLYNELKKFNIKTTLLTIENGKHGMFSKSENLQFKKELWQFLNELNLINP